MTDTVRRSGKKNRKHHRNVDSPSMKRYFNEGRQLKNKKRKLLKHIKNNPNDKQSIRASNG